MEIDKNLQNTLAKYIVEAGQPDQEVANILAHTRLKKDFAALTGIKMAVEQDDSDFITTLANEIVEGFDHEKNQIQEGIKFMGTEEIQKAREILVAKHEVPHEVAIALTHTLGREHFRLGPDGMATSMLEARERFKA